MLYEIKESNLWYRDKNTCIFNENAEMKQYNEYAALYDMSGAGDIHTMDKSSIYCDFYKEGKYIFSLKRNSYRPPHEMFLEFFEHDNKIVFMFNLYHGQITIHNANTGKIVGYDKQDDKFITYWSLSNDKKFMYLEGWWWNPIDFQAIYNIENLLNVKDYGSVIIYDETMSKDYNDDYDSNDSDNFINFNKETNKFVLKDTEYEINEFFKLIKK